MSLCIVHSTITVWKVNSNIIIQQFEKLYICRGYRVHRGLRLDESEFTKSVIVFICFTLLGHIAFFITLLLQYYSYCEHYTDE